MDETGYERRSSSLSRIADQVESPAVAALLRRYAAEFAAQARATRRERRRRRLVRAGRTLGLAI